MLRKFRSRLRGYVPFSNWWILWKHFDKSAKSILDLGCGTGNPMTFINRNRNLHVVGIDGFQPSVDRCKQTGNYDFVFFGDLRTFGFQDKSFDTVIALQVLEHLDKPDGELLIEKMEKIAKKQIIVSTDVNEFAQGEVGGNELQRHRYIWSIDELESLGFQHIHGIGPRGYGGDNGYGRWLPQPLRWMVAIGLQLLVGPVVYSHPKYAGAVVCIKNLK